MENPGGEPLRGQWLETRLLTRLREDRVFGSAEELISAMDQDRARAAEYWSSKARAGGPG